MNIPLLITSAINVSAPQTELTNQKLRIHYTVEYIKKWIDTNFFNRIVICDGSGYDLNPVLVKIKTHNPNIQIEVINFINNQEAVRDFGKGYGEGEIINYALQNSKIINSCEIFCKCTSKLFVKNFYSYLDTFNGNAAFNFMGIFSPKKIDTRFYIVSKNFYNTYLSTAYLSVDDKNKFYLEHAFAKSLSIRKVSDYIMHVCPEIIGISGSSNELYNVNILLNKIRSIRLSVIKNLRLW